MDLIGNLAEEAYFLDASLETIDGAKIANQLV